jgi:hypothetical protein
MVWQADLQCRRWPSPRNLNGYALAVDYLRRLEVHGP